jgi:hypothetical protein
MRKAVSIFFIVMGLALMFICSSEHYMKIIIAKRSALNGWFGIHHSNAGDLVSMSYLDNVKKFRESYNFYFTKPAADSGGSKIDLYVYGDSYLDPIPDSAFGPINSYHFARRSYNDLNYSLDPHKKNILILEYAERFTRGELQYYDLYNHVKKKQADGTFLRLSDHPVTYAKIFGFQIFNHEINPNLEFNLFGYRFWDEVKLTKASLNYYFFRRAMGDVVISDDGNRLFLKQTVDPEDQLSSFRPLDPEEIQNIIQHINAIYDHYKAEGFDEVWLSLIPNPVTILQPEHYNGLIPALQQPGVLKGMQMIDIFSQYKKAYNPGSLFRVGDTHWSNNGMQVWLKTVNAELKKQNLKAK